MSRRKILTVVGARPEFIKAMAVSRAIGARETCREVMVHTGQHFDAGMSDVFFCTWGAERQEPVASAVRSRGRAGPPRKDVSSRGPLSRLCSTAGRSRVTLLSIGSPLAYSLVRRIASAGSSSADVIDGLGA